MPDKPDIRITDAREPIPTTPEQMGTKGWKKDFEKYPLGLFIGKDINTSRMIARIGRVRLVETSSHENAMIWAKEHQPDVIILRGSGDRDKQWITKYLNDAESPSPIVVYGLHYRAVAKRLGATAYVPMSKPEIVIVQAVQLALGYPESHCILNEINNPHDLDNIDFKERGFYELNELPPLEESSLNTRGMLLRPVSPRKPFWRRPHSHPTKDDLGR